MTPQQIELARHALGLPNDRRRSYRNYFTAGTGHPDFADWIAMIKAGTAKRRISSRMAGGDDVFWLTIEGAQAALQHGESLDPEDFPALCVSPGNGD
jgi:hypothetical protein